MVNHSGGVTNASSKVHPPISKTNLPKTQQPADFEQIVKAAKDAVGAYTQAVGCHASDLGKKRITAQKKFSELSKLAGERLCNDNLDVEKRSEIDSTLLTLRDQMNANDKSNMALAKVRSSTDDRSKGKAQRELRKALKDEFNTELRTQFPHVKNGHYTAAQRKQAANKIWQTHAGHGVVAVLVDQVTGQLRPDQAVRQWLAKTKENPSDSFFTGAENELARKDPVTLSFMKSGGLILDGLNFKGEKLSPQEETLAEHSAPLFGILQLARVQISDGKHFLPIVTENGKRLRLRPDQLKAWNDHGAVGLGYQLFQLPPEDKETPAQKPQTALKKRPLDRVEIRRPQTDGLSQITLNRGIGELMAATAAARIDYTEVEMAALTKANKWGRRRQFSRPIGMLPSQKKNRTRSGSALEPPISTMTISIERSKSA
jgi:hypothetical protein